MALLGLILTVAAAAWVASPILDPDFRRLYSTQSLALAIGLMFVAVAASSTFLFLPQISVYFGAILLLLICAFLIREVVSRRRSSPPGIVSPVASIRGLANPDFYKQLFETHGPIATTSQFGRKVVCIEGISRGQKLFREHRDALGPSPLAFSNDMMGDFLRYMDDSTHEFYSPLFRRAISPAVVTAAIAEAHISFEKQVTCFSTAPTDPRRAIKQAVEESLLWALFGIDPASDEGVQFLSTLASFGNRSIGRRMNFSTKRDFELLRVQARFALHNSSTSFSSVIHELHRLDANQPDGVAIDNLIFMLSIGSSNTAALTVWAVQHLAKNPDLRHRLATGEAGLAEALVWETLRLSQSEYLYRRLKANIRFEGAVLRRGWMVRICTAESHKSTESFECPLDFTVRFRDGKPDASKFSPFGLDRHACNAAPLATSIAAALLSDLARDDSLTLVPSQSLVRDFRYWSHWRPGDDLGIIRATRSNFVQ